MKNYFAMALKLLLGTLGFLSVLVALGSSYMVYHAPGKNDFGSIFGLMVGLILLPAVLGYFFFRVAAIDAWSWKLFCRISLRTLGSLAICTGFIMAFGAIYDLAHRNGAGFVIFFLCTFVFVPVAGGYLLLNLAADREDTPADIQRSRIRVHHLGVGLVLLFLLAIAALLPLTGRVTVLVLLMLIFARVHRGWSSRRFRTTFGGISYADVFDLMVRGTLCVTAEVLFALLTGGRSIGSFSGGRGGSSGGGGASGRW